jgi:Undecaprenyl-phosphate glucose phosphotransferase
VSAEYPYRLSQSNTSRRESKPRLQFIGRTPWLIFSCINVVTIVALSILSGVAYHLYSYDTVGELRSYFGMGLLTALVFLAVQRMKGSPAVFKSASISEICEERARAWLLTVLFSLALMFTLKLGGDLSRGAIFFMFVTGFPTLVISRIAGGAVLEFISKRLGVKGRKTVYILGLDKTMAPSERESLVRLGYDPKTFVWADSGQEFADVVERINSEVQRISADAVVIDLPLSSDLYVSQLVKELGDIPVQIVWILDQGPMRLLERPFGISTRRAAIELRRPPMTRFEKGLKRSVDVSFASLSLLMLSPLLLVVAALIKLDSKGPVIFQQKRRGLDGKPFIIYKFRSMKVMENGPVVTQARRGDPRFTRMGEVIRRLSIDELPQLLNVLKGDMSLIGPRPHAVAHDDEYTQHIPNYDLRYFMKPGLTGWAQVKGYRGETRTLDAMEKRIECDLWYANNWSFLLDIKILLKTAFIVLEQKNAH